MVKVKRLKVCRLSPQSGESIFNFAFAFWTLLPCGSLLRAFPGCKEVQKDEPVTSVANMTSGIQNQSQKKSHTNTPD